jgi:transposase
MRVAIPRAQQVEMVGTIDLEIRPIRHWSAERMRAHVFLCMLAYHVEWHLRQAVAPVVDKSSIA